MSLPWDSHYEFEKNKSRLMLRKQRQSAAGRSPVATRNENQEYHASCFSWPQDCVEFKFMPKRCNIPQELWDEAAEVFELGFKHANAIAHDLGVSPQTVMREMRRRGARKGARASETVTELNAQIDLKQQREARRREAIRAAKEERREAMDAALSAMFEALLEADQRGELGLTAGMIEDTATALGVQVARRSRSR